MEWRKSPGLVIYPGVSPRLDIVPMAVVIGSPTADGGAGKPDIAVIGSVTPRAVIIQILITHDVG
jgi:hypothetical protein